MSGVDAEKRLKAGDKIFSLEDDQTRSDHHGCGAFAAFKADCGQSGDTTESSRSCFCRTKPKHSKMQ
jgi:hypothetical protein